MNTYLISYAEDVNNVDILKDRIKNLGDYCSFFNNNWLVKCTLESAMEVHQAIAKEDFISSRILVLRIDASERLGYWGFMNKSLWDWLGESRKQETTQEPSVESQQ